MIYKQPWFWVVVISAVISVAAFILLFLTSGNQSLYIIAGVVFLVLAIAALVYGLTRKKTETALVLQEEDLKTRKQFSKSFQKALANFNQETDAPVQKYAQEQLPARFGEFGESVGRIGAQPITSSVRVFGV